MILVLVTALIAVCGADKLDRTYLPPASANTAGGSPGSLQTPFRTFNQGLGGLPKGGYNNEFEGVVVDASAPGTRASGADDTGLGGPRVSYGSLDSKVGEAAFTADTAFPRVGTNSGLNTQFGANSQGQGAQPERIQAARDRASNTVKYQSDVSPDRFNYAFETDNGIVAEENGIEVNGVKAQGGYSYTGDDGQVYSVTYTADEEGYRPKGDHLPTPPPIPVEILESLEKNAQDEAAGIIDDGSYDAQKYNTGEDYTKTDNGQYNNGQPTQLGYRPQTDAVASGSFINQNNQGFVRPNSQQFGSTFSQDSSKNVPSSGNNFGIAGGADKPAQNKQTFGFGVTSNNEYSSPSNSFNFNGRPGLNGPQGSTNNVQIPSYNSNGFNKNQNAGTSAFVPLAQQKLQDDKPKRPQSGSPIFGKPTVIDSTLSIKDPFAKRPSANRLNQNKQPYQKPQPIGGSFEVVSGNVYSSKNEYLPPRRQGNTANQNNGNQRFQGTNSGTTTNQQFINSQPFNSNSPSASAFASVSRPSLGLQTSQQYSSQQISQTLDSTNPSGNNAFNQVNQNYNNRPSNEQQTSLSPSQPNAPSFNGSPASQSHYRPSTFASQSPTLTPQLELSTPIVSNSNLNKNTAPVPVIDGPDSSSQAGPFGLPSFGIQPSSNFQAQYGFNSNKLQQASPTQQSTSAVSLPSDQSITAGSQGASQSGRPLGNSGYQSQPSKSSENGQYSISTQRPSFNQYSQQQGADNSYYYNSPLTPFNQDNRFPSTSFDQSFKVTQTPFGSKPQSGNSGSFFTAQGSTPSDDGRYPKPSTPESISPTQPTQQDGQNGNQFQSQFNKVTQAASSSFPSPTPTISAGFNGNQFGTRPTQPADRLSQGTQGFNQQESSRPQQQYGGEIYEYNKPPQTLSTPQNSASSGQFGQPQFGSSSNTLSSQTQAPGTNTPSSQFGSKFPQQPFGQRPQSSQDSQNNQAFNINSGQAQQKPGQFGSQQNLNQNTQPTQGASKFPPTYSQNAPPCCKQLPSSQTSPGNEQGGNSQFSTQFRPNQDFSQQGSEGVKPVQSVSTFAGVGESFAGNRKPPSVDSTGYHY